LPWFAPAVVLDGALLRLEAVRGAKSVARIADHPRGAGLAETAIQTTETLLAVGTRRAAGGGRGTRNGPGWTRGLAAKIGVTDRARHGAGVVGSVFADAGAIRIVIAARRAAAGARRATVRNARGAASASEIAAAVRNARGAAHQRAARG